MAPLQSIKDGIKSRDWALVIDGYNQLTGEALTVGPNESAAAQEILEKIKSIVGLNKEDAPHIETTPIKTKQTSHKKTVKPEPKLSKITKVKKLTKQQLEADEIPLTNKGIAGIRKQPFVSGPVNARGNIPDLPAALEINDEEMVLNKKTAKKQSSVGRQAYEAVIVKCDKCSKEFDFNKAYPMGILDPQNKQTYCAKCQINRR